MFRCDRARSRLLHRRQQVLARRQDGRRQPEQERRDDRDRGDESQHRQVDLVVEERTPIGRHQEQQAARRPAGADDADRAAGPRHQQALGEQLPDQAPAGGAERQAQRELAPPRHRPRQQQHGDVGARDQQHHADHRHHQQQRVAVVRAQRVDPDRAGLEPDVRRLLRIGLRQRVGDERLEHRVGLRARFTLVHAGLEPRHHVRPPVAADRRAATRCRTAESPTARDPEVRASAPTRRARGRAARRRTAATSPRRS